MTSEFIQESAFDGQGYTPADLPGMNSQDCNTSLRTRGWELDLSVYPTWPKESGVQDIDAVGGHDNLDVLRRFETV